MPSFLNLNSKNISLGLPLKRLPKIPKQFRKRQAIESMPERKMMGADTETVNGKVWLFSTEKGVWEIKSFYDMMTCIYSKPHLSKWKKTKKSGRGRKLRGFSPMEFFFWNLKYDAQAIFRTLHDNVVKDLIMSKEEYREKELGKNKIIVNAKTGNYGPKVNGEMVELEYLEGKNLVITPINWSLVSNHGTVYHLGKCYWWDISQFYGKMKLQTASEIYLNSSKVELMFDGNILDAGRFDEEEYRDYYREDIEKYAVQDAVLTGELSRLKRREFVDNEIRFIRPYSIANVAQRNLLDTCKIPTVNSYSKNSHLTDILRYANSSYYGGWFETSGAGYQPDVQSIDLSSAYPYVMTYLDNLEKGKWIYRHGKENLLKYLEKREPMSLGFAEVSFFFDAHHKWNPLVTKNIHGTLITPRLVRGWYSMDEIQEALKWPIKSFRIGKWFYFEPETDEKPFKKFIDKHYTIKSNSVPDSVEYRVAKILQNSVYGKLIQAVDNKAGKLWNPIYAATTTGATRARIAEIVRENDFSAFQVATDGVFFDVDDLVEIPNRPKKAVLNLGQWELENRGEFLSLMSGVYSMRESNDKIKTRFRGNASYFLRGNNLFDFCDENSDYFSVSKVIRKPYSAKEARTRDDMSLMNVFRNVKQTVSVQGDNQKRLWKQRPETFSELTEKWYDSYPHIKVH